MSDRNNAVPGLFTILNQVVDGLATRLQIASIELSVAKNNAAKTAIYAVLAALFGLFALVFISVALLVIFWEDHRIFVSCCIAGVYLLLFRRFPVIEVTMTGFCMRTWGQTLTRGQTFLLAAAGPGMNGLLAAIWAMRMEQCATIRGSAFLAANLLTGAFNLLPVPPLDGAQMLRCLLQSSPK